MARATMILLIAGCVMLAAVCVQAEKFEFDLYEHAPESNQILSFQAKTEEGGNEMIGNGYVYQNVATETENANSKRCGYVAGLTFYTTAATTSEVMTISFSDKSAYGIRFAGAELHLRGLWNLNEDGSDNKKQEMAIVGGSYGLANAYGTVKYTKRSGDVWHLEGNFQIDDCSLVPV